MQAFMYNCHILIYKLYIQKIIYINFILVESNFIIMAHEPIQAMKAKSVSLLSQRESRQTNLLKFINQNNSYKRVQGKRCKPGQMFGYNEQSPDHFKSKNSLKAAHGYIYQYDNNPANQQFQYYSQQHFIDLGNQGSKEALIKTKTDFQNKFEQSMNGNKLAFHRRKGKLSEFMDKNGWMNKATKIMGFERSQTARKCNQIDRMSKIKQKKQEIQKKQKNMSLPVKKPKRFQSDHTKLSQILLTDKMKTRELRNQFANIQINKNESRPYTTMEMKSRTKFSDRQLAKQQKVTESVRLLDYKPKDFEKTLEIWQTEDNQRVRWLEWSNPKKTDEWMQTTCGSKFSNPQSVLQYRRK